MTELTLPEKVADAWHPRRWGNFTVAVAVSGGADSVCMLRALDHLKRQHTADGELVVIHVNHGLRGAASDSEAQFVTALARRLDWPVIIVDGELPQTETHQGDGLEARLRDRRYEAFADVAARVGARYLVTGHTRDDQVETILFRALRGTGIEGLSGIPSHRVINDSLTVVRPLLEISRYEITQYLKQIDQDHCVDGSNAELRFTRNRLRHQILPDLRGCFENSIDEALLQLARHAENQTELLDQLCLPLLEGNFQIESHRIRITRPGLDQYPRELVMFGLRKAWRMAGFPEADMNARKWRSLVARLLDELPPKKSTGNYPGPIRVVSDRGSMQIERG